MKQPLERGNSELVKIGVVGAGFIGQLGHIYNYSMIPACQMVALAELRPELGRQVSQRYGIMRNYRTHHELLEDPEVEAVVVVTARSLTGPIALDCLRAGKHLLTEKPMAATLEQAEKLVEVANSKGVHYSVGYMKRHDEGVQRAKDILDGLLATGELGPIIFVRVHNFMGGSYSNIDGHLVTDERVPDGQPQWPIAPDWVPESRQQDYGRFLNSFCHNINLLRYLLGRTPSVLFAHLRHQLGRVAVLDFGDYLTVLEVGRLESRAWEEVVEIYFAKARLSIELPPTFLRNVPANVRLYKGGDMNEMYSPQCDWTWAFRRQAEAFVAGIKENREPIASGADALDDMRLVEDMWRLELEVN